MTNTDDGMAFDVEVRDDRTILTIEGVRDAAVIVRSPKGERIYLPPEDFDAEPTVTTPYSTSPYSTADESTIPTTTRAGQTASSTADRRRDDTGDPETADDVPSPYSKTTDDAPADNPEYGRTRISQGIRIVHPDPVTDVRVVR
ncbi:DUF7510 family protein [Halapricum desulfuricans]|uniref:Uncharacterized protein n=1 Tax=Halapricum desulfuricans TaxID=2841257 RepID=A0A897NGA7_9EURY|nr:hypothetical protein [Halapricum desulfuricans]QSG08672.1 Uncharacterized protein HSR122_1274 [Halapricum desulfuricans]QSG11618.1 Uncharacterized protein HSBGL_1194 [Halapricum desulfuricans]